MSEHHHYHSSNNGFTGGLLLGALIGAGVALLLGTKRGKEIAEEFKEKGLSLVGEFDELLDELEEDIEEETPPAIPTTSSNETHSTQSEQKPGQQSDVQSQSNFSTVKVEQAGQSSSVPSHIESLQAHGRRLFHGIPKRR